MRCRGGRSFPLLRQRRAPNNLQAPAYNNNDIHFPFTVVSKYSIILHITQGLLTITITNYNVGFLHKCLTYIFTSIVLTVESQVKLNLFDIKSRPKRYPTTTNTSAENHMFLSVVRTELPFP
jgi:hypothetical protein